MNLIPGLRQLNVQGAWGQLWLGYPRLGYILNIPEQLTDLHITSTCSVLSSGENAPPRDSPRHLTTPSSMSGLAVKPRLDIKELLF